MAALVKNSRLRKPFLFGLSILIHIILIFVLSVSNITQQKDVKKKELRIIKVARVIKAKNKKTTKTKKPKPKEKVVKKKKPSKKAKKASAKSPRLAKAKKIKTTKLKKSQTKVEKAKLKVVKKLRLQEEKQTRKNIQKAKSIPTPKKMVQKKVEEFKPRKVTKVVQQKKITPKLEKNLTVHKFKPKQLVTKTKFVKVQEQKVQKLKRKVKKIERNKSIIKPQKTPQLAPSQNIVKKEIVEKKIVPNKTPIKPVQKTFELVKNLPQKIEPRISKRKIHEARKNVKIKKVTPTKSVEFKAQELKQQKVQKLNRVREAVKLTRRVITKPRLAPTIKQPQKVVRKKVVKEELTQPVKDFSPVRKKITTQIKKKITPKIVEQVQAPRKLESLLAVEKTKSAPTMTTVKVEDIVEDKPKMVQEVEQVFRRQVPTVTTPQEIPVLQEKPVLNSAPVVPQNKQTMEAQTVPQTETREKIEKEINYTQTTSTPTKVTKTTKQKVNYQTSQAVVSERNIQPTLTEVASEVPATEAPQVAVTEAVSRKSVASAVPTTASTAAIARSTSFDAPQTEMQLVKQTVAAAATSTRSSEETVEKEVKFDVAKAAAGSVVPTQKAVTYQVEATTQVTVREVSSDVAPVAEFSPETQAEATTNIATSARSTTHVQSALSGSVTSNVKANISQDQDLPTSEQSKEFTQAAMTTNSGEAGDVEGKTIQTERISDGAAKATEFAEKASSRNDFGGIDSSATPTERKGTGMGEGGPQIMVDIPSGNMTNTQLFRLSGVIDGDVRGAFVTVNGSTQIAVVENGNILADVALVKGINDISILAFNPGGGVGKKDFQLLYTPPQGVPTIVLESPENGRQGAKAGDPVIVEGRIDDVWISQAKLLLNGVPIPLKVKDGRFRRKIFLPETRVTTFRIMATGKNGQTGYSSLHTVLIGYDIDIRNPRPY